MIGRTMRLCLGNLIFECLMLPLKFPKMDLGRHVFPALFHQIATPFARSIETNQNCRAIRDGVIPALKAARTAFT